MTIEQLLHKLYHDIIGAYQGVLDPISWGKIVYVFHQISLRIICLNITRSFYIFPVYQIEKLRKS